MKKEKAQRRALKKWALIVDRDDTDQEYFEIVEDNPESWAHPQGPLHIIRRTYTGDSVEKLENARLLVSAPEMLAALEAIMEKQEDASMFRLPANCKEIKQVKDAIARAKGDK